MAVRSALILDDFISVTASRSKKGCEERTNGEKQLSDGVMGWGAQTVRDDAGRGALAGRAALPTHLLLCRSMLQPERGAGDRAKEKRNSVRRSTSEPTNEHTSEQTSKRTNTQPK